MPGRNAYLDGLLVSGILLAAPPLRPLSLNSAAFPKCERTTVCQSVLERGPLIGECAPELGGFMRRFLPGVVIPELCVLPRWRRLGAGCRIDRWRPSPNTSEAISDRPPPVTATRGAKLTFS